MTNTVFICFEPSMLGPIVRAVKSTEAKAKKFCRKEYYYEEFEVDSS